MIGRKEKKPREEDSVLGNRGTIPRNSFLRADTKASKPQTTPYKALTRSCIP